MKIIIKDSEDKRRFFLLIPTRLIKWKWIYNIGAKHTNDEKSKQEIITFRDNSKRFYKAIKGYIKENGHFTLVDVKSNDGSIVKIII